MHIKHITYNTLLFLLLLIFPQALMAASVKVTQQGSGKYSVGQTFTVVIELDGLQGGGNIPAFKGCEVVGTSSSQMQSITYDTNNRAQLISQIKQVVTLKAVAPGNYTYGPITVNGTKSNTISYNIGGSTAPTQTTSSVNVASAPAPSFTVADDDVMMMRATVSNKTTYVQQPVSYTVRIYAVEPLRSYPTIEDPKTPNGVFDVIPDSQKNTIDIVNINGRQYYCYELYTSLFYPSKTGQITVDGGSITCYVPGYGNLKSVCNDVTLDVKPLPDYDKHTDINGVGNYKVSSELKNEHFRAGEPILVTYTVSGTGNPSFVSLPDVQQQLPKGLKFIKSESKITKNYTANNVDAVITFECIIMPQREGVYKVPALKFNFFNPATSEWYTKSTTPMTIDVAEGDSSFDFDDNFVFNSDLQEFTEDARGVSFYISSPLYWLWYLIPLLILTSVLLYYRKRMALYADTTLLKRKRANSVARKRMRAAAVAMKANSRDLFYDELLQAVWGYLGDKLSMPTSELSRSNIKEQMAAFGLSDYLSDQVISFIDECEFAKYGSSSDANMQEVYSRVSQLIDNIDNTINQNKTHQNSENV